MATQSYWWARTKVGWHPVETQDQVVVLPQSEAETALAWLKVLDCTSWSEVARISPEIEAYLREYDEDADDEEADEADEADDRFDLREFPGYDDGNLPPAPWAVMAQRLPANLVAACGITEDTVFSGTYVTFPGDRLDAILAWLAEHGFVAEEHPELGRALQDLAADAQ